MSAQAKFSFQRPGGKPEELAVHFNPASLECTVTNTLKEEGAGNARKQYVTQSTAKLSMTLFFDTTLTGEDVRAFTGRIAALMEPVKEGKRTDVPAIVTFEWGSYAFKGMIEEFKETIDFFAPNGVPLRSAVTLRLARQDRVFDESKAQGAAGPVDLPLKKGESAPSRALASANGLENMRLPEKLNLTVGGAPAAQAPSDWGAAAGAAFAALRAPARNAADTLPPGQPSAFAGSGGGMAADVAAGQSLWSRIQFEEE